MISDLFRGSSVLLFKSMIGPSSAPARRLAPWSRLVSILVTIILILALLRLSVLVVIPVLLLVVVVPPLLRGGPALVGCLVLFLGVKVVVGGEGVVVEVVVVALVGAGVRLLLPGVQLQRAVPHPVTTVDQQT